MIAQVEELDADLDERVELGALNGSLGFLLRVSQLRAFERFYDAFGQIDLRPGEFSAMWVIALNSGLRQGLLADTLEIKPARMTKMIRRLEDASRVRRVIPESDRRSVRLYLTPAGERFVRDHEAAFLGHDDYHHHDLDAAERRQLAHLLRRYCGLGRTS